MDVSAAGGVNAGEAEKAVLRAPAASSAAVPRPEKR